MMGNNIKLLKHKLLPTNVTCTLVMGFDTSAFKNISNQTPFLGSYTSVSGPSTYHPHHMTVRSDFWVTRVAYSEVNYSSSCCGCPSTSPTPTPPFLPVAITLPFSTIRLLFVLPDTS